MLIDAILDRRDGVPYNAKKFYNYLLGSFDCYKPVTYAMDYGTEEEVQEALCRYIIEQEYNPSICDYIRSVKWIENDDGSADRNTIYSRKDGSKVMKKTTKYASVYDGRSRIERRVYKHERNGYFYCIINGYYWTIDYLRDRFSIRIY